MYQSFQNLYQTFKGGQWQRVFDCFSKIDIYLAQLFNNQGTLTQASNIDLILRSNQIFDAPTVPDGTVVVYILRQDGTGGRTVTWRNGFSAFSSSIDTTALSISIFSFISSNGKLMLMAQNTTGMVV